MPVPTPPKANLLQVQKPVRLSTRVKKQPQGPSKSTEKLVADVRALTDAIKDEKNLVEITPKKTPAPKKEYIPPEHLTQSPFRDNEGLQALQRSLEKEKPPVKRNPRRKPASKKTQGEK